MLRQALTMPSRALRSSTRSLSQRPTSRPQIFIAPVAVRRIQPAAARWYSDEPAKEATEAQKKEGEAKGTTAAEGEQAAATPAEDPALAELKKKYETKDKEAAEWKDKCLRTIADFRNLQDRTAREVKSAREFAIQGFAKDLIDSVDNLDRALAMVDVAKLGGEEKTEAQQDLANLYEGIKMTDGILHSTLKKHGLERFDPDGDKFNPNEHDAVAHIPMEGKENGTVGFVQQKGFKLNSRILRAAKVGVVKNAA